MFVHDEVGGAPNARTPDCDSTLHVSETSEGLHGSIDVQRDLFEAHTIQRICGHYGALLESVARGPDQRVQTVPMLTEEERARVLFEWNDTSAELPDTCAHGLFEEQVARTPDATALVFENVTLTYRELNERANQVAHHLRKHGVGPEVLVGVCLGRSADLAVALLGVWKAGGAYVPLDPDAPAGSTRVHGARRFGQGARDRRRRASCCSAGRGSPSSASTRMGRSSRRRAPLISMRARRRRTSPTSCTPPDRPASRRG